MQKTKKYIKYILTILTIISIILLITIKIKLNNKETSIVEEKKELYSVVPEEEPTPEITKVSVDIKGAVTNPGVYEIENDKKVIDQTTPNMIQRISGIFARNPLISKEI